jgi:hypothetical protein
MDFKLYIEKFQAAANRINKKTLAKKQIEMAVGIYQQSVFLKLYKKQWANNTGDPLTSASRIFFSVWINDAKIDEQKIFYNIHALKLRQLSGYAITSRDFAGRFRKQFKPFMHHWPNVSVHFGPLTLMQGYVNINHKNMEQTITTLASNFLNIEHLIDGVLEMYKK